jgi:hypothetical protein
MEKTGIFSNEELKGRLKHAKGEQRKNASNFIVINL